MKNKKIIITAIICIIAGFLLAWFVKPARGMENGPAAHQHVEPEEAKTWTCSMHPQIRQNEPGLCPICEMDLILLDENKSSDPLVLEMTEEAIKLASISTSLVGTAGNSEKVIHLGGKIQEDERLSSSQVSHIPGRIEQLFVSFTGERIKKGQKLAAIYAPELITAQRELLEAKKLQDLQPGLLEASRNKLHNWKIPEKTIAEIEAGGQIQETFVLEADESATVSKRRVSVGDYVGKGQVLFDLQKLNKVWVLLDAYEEDLANIRLGTKVNFTSPAIPNKTFYSKITFIDPYIDPKTRVTALRAEVNNPRGLLKPEMLVQATIQSPVSGKEKLSVPKSAVLWTGPRSVVYVKVPDTSIPSFEYREVKIGESLGDHYLIESGLEAGEEVVTNGSFAIDAAAQLNNQQSMMNKVVKVKGSEGPSGPDFVEESPSDFKKQLHLLSQKYLVLKDALVATDPESAAPAAAAFISKMGEIDMDLVKEEAHLFWMAQARAMGSHAEKISLAKDVEVQRKQFDFLSGILIKTIAAFGVEGGDLYVQHCPMAFDDTGADWLSDEEAILNPYFGDKMLRCGFVKDSFPGG